MDQFIYKKKNKSKSPELNKSRNELDETNLTIYEPVF